MAFWTRFKGINIIQGYGDGTIPSGGKIFKLKTTEFTENPSDKYEDTTKLLNDERIYSLVALVASLVQNAYKGVYIKPTSRYSDTVLTPEEEKVLQLADEFVGDTVGLDYKQLFFDIAWNIALYGEDIFVYELDKNDGVVGLKSIPLNSAYFVETENQIQQKEIKIYKDNILVVRNSENDRTPARYKKERFEHPTYHSRGVWRNDIEGRQTYGVYSVVPVKSLQNMYKWKLKTMENDVAWKNKLMPRILHVLSMAGINPSQYPGATKTEKTKAAISDANTIIQNFKNNTKIDTPDEDLITTGSVNTSILEPKSTSYQDPNKTLEQINKSFNTPFGIPEGQIGGGSGTAMTTELDSIFESIRAETIAHVVAKALGNALRKHLTLVAPTSSDVIKRIYLHTDTMLPVHKHSLARSVLALANSKSLLKSELREVMNLPPVPQLPDSMYVQADTPVRTTPAQTTKDMLQETPGSDTSNKSPDGQKNSGESILR